MVRLQLQEALCRSDYRWHESADDPGRSQAARAAWRTAAALYRHEDEALPADRANDVRQRASRGPVIEGAVLTASEMDQFARDDGFGGDEPALRDMTRFWYDSHSSGDRTIELEFHGVLVRWRELS